jgi:hypothetical protein
MRAHIWRQYVRLAMSDSVGEGGKPKLCCQHLNELFVEWAEVVGAVIPWASPTFGVTDSPLYQHPHVDVSSIRTRQKLASPNARSCYHSFAAFCRVYRALLRFFLRTCATHRRCSGARSRLQTFYALPHV